MITFFKYQGCGNDFILIDARTVHPQLTSMQIAKLCDRRFGIGADGLMYIFSSSSVDFDMEYYNSDGGKSSFCGNGGRCIVAFAKFLNIIDTEAIFSFENSIYKALIHNEIIDLYMQNIKSIYCFKDDFCIDTGSPHYIHFENKIDNFSLIPYAKEIRFSSDFPEGINVNIVEIEDEKVLKIRTYERGVEDETYSCGTGVTAAVLVYADIKGWIEDTIEVKSIGGKFKVKFKKENNSYNYVILSGPALQVFKGEIDL